MPGLSLSSELTADHLPLLEPVVQHAGAEWKPVMRHILPEGNKNLLKEIHQHNLRSVCGAFREALYSWLEMPGAHTLEDIAKALDASGYRAVANRLRAVAGR